MTASTNHLLPKNYELREVFTAGGFPKLTYVRRDHLKLESDLRHALDKGFAIIAITGQSKSGKTVLAGAVTEGNKVIKVHGGQCQTSDDIWSQILHQAGESFEKNKNLLSMDSEETGIKGGLSLGIGNVEINQKAGNQNSVNSTIEYFNNPKMQAISFLKNNKIILIIDDFHYMEEKARKDTIRALKPYVFDGGQVIVISVPYRAFSVVDAEGEMEGRFRHIEIPEWTSSDLMRILEAGEPLLNVRFSQSMKVSFTNEALGNPLLTQNFCFDACYNEGVKSTCPQEFKFEDDFNCNAVFVKAAQDVGFPIFSKLERGPQSRSDRLPRPFKNGSKGDTYQSILAAIAVTGPQKELSYETIRSALREEILKSNYPQKHEVTAAIKQMVGIAKDIERDNPAIDFHEDRVFIQNPFFQFYLRWIHRPNFAESLDLR
ncbi:hypothetical protein ACI6QG_01555 [Roseococcus sp. DSY-14]|uniref:hypothetical protein n=1 Tax=Roseococcus sp. DSY-14 TaxID=3369650 RepID=UPI00387B20FB